jgi:hypothetical protein
MRKGYGARRNNARAAGESFDGGGDPKAQEMANSVANRTRVDAVDESRGRDTACSGPCR